MAAAIIEAAASEQLMIVARDACRTTRIAGRKDFGECYKVGYKKGYHSPSLFLTVSC